MTVRIPLPVSKNSDGEEEKLLKRLKRNVENAYDSFKPNYERYTKFRNFIFVSAMAESARAVNNDLQRPSIEANVIESYLSRMCGEYSKYEPGVVIAAADDVVANDPQEREIQDKQIEILTGIWRYVLYDANKRGFQRTSYKNSLSGGYNSAKIYTEYAGERKFEQEIKIENTFDQTLVFFDVLAAAPDKSDGNYCGEIVPMRVEDFKQEFGDVDISDMKFQGKMIESTHGLSTLGPFNWSYKVGDESIILVADYYEKKKTRTTLYKLSDGRNVTKKEYKDIVKSYDDLQLAKQAPIVIDKRETEIVTIERYQFIQNKLLNHEPTSFKRLPIKFIDGNSIVTKDDSSGACYQMTKPFFYHAEGVQRLKNYALQSLANELENMRPQTIIASLESIPPQYLDAYRKPQNMTTLIYNAFLDGNPMHPLAPPTFAQRNPIPAEISQTLNQCDIMIQNIMGAADASSMQMTAEQASGKAIQELISMSNTAAVPYIDSQLLGLESLAQDVIDLIPVYYKTERSVPIIDSMGNHSFVEINKEGGIKMDYQPGDFKVKVEAGVSFGVQQSRALQQIFALANAMPKFGEFINQDGMDIVLKNVECLHADELRHRSEGWMEQQKAANAAAQEAAANQPSIEMQAMQIAQSQVQSEHQAAMAKLEQQAQAEQLKMQAKMADIELGYKKLEIELAKIVSSNRIEEEKLGIAQQKADDERITTVIDSAIKQSQHHHDTSQKAFERSMAEKTFEKEEKEITRET